MDFGEIIESVRSGRFRDNAETIRCLQDLISPTKIRLNPREHLDLCGIFGFIISENVPLSANSLLDVANRLFKLSESRGKEASGLALRMNGTIYVFKEPVSSSQLVKSRQYRDLFKRLKSEAYVDGYLKAPVAIFGHSRLQTNGQSEINSNNQPIVKDGSVGIHNGIIVNDSDLWKAFPELDRKFEVDTEIFLALLQLFRNRGLSVMDAAREVFSLIEGSASVAVMLSDSSNVLLASNTGSLYTCMCRSNKILVFASEEHILQQVAASPKLKGLGFDEVVQVEAGEGCLIDVNTMREWRFNLKSREDRVPEVLGVADSKIVELYDQSSLRPSLSVEPCVLREDVKQSMMQTWRDLYSGSVGLKRCSRCLLPETMPYISFDDHGVCSYCREYEHRGSFVKGEQALEEFVSKYRKGSGKVDCIVGFSGGRDSSYGLDYLKNQLGMNPTTFTYDWGMVNDLARRNQARVVGRLGIEHIVISADIRKKRENIRKNLKAWLKRPDLGMVPILMAGDKQFYYYFHKIRKQTGVKLFVFCGGYEAEEGTGLFKYGFCNVSQGSEEALKRMTGISPKNKLKILWYYLRQFIRNPAYINKSMIDTLFAFYSSYVLPDDYLYLFHYLDWDEKEIMSSITEKFNWERETDTIATWRTDDGTAAFYNYIYLTMAGFSEFDIFRSHQIREGKITREEAFNLIKEENKPRFRSIEWYGQAIGFDMNKAIELINEAPKLYEIKPMERKMAPELTATLPEIPESQRIPLVARNK